MVESLFNKGLQLIKKRLQRRCFHVKFAKLLRTAFFTEHLWWLLLNFVFFFLAVAADLINTFLCFKKILFFLEHMNIAVSAHDLCSLRNFHVLQFNRTLAVRTDYICLLSIHFTY